MYVDDPMILELIALLKAHNVRHVVIAPGSRHYPIVRSLEYDSDFTLYSVVDERSAGFFAIGTIHAIRQPVAVLTTSGTAGVNLSSAVADAYYQRLPLVAITADRLPQFLDQMEDQMIDQEHLFTGSVRARALLRPITGDIDHWYDNRVLNEALLALRVNGTGPIHINVPILNHSNMTYSVRDLPEARVMSHHVPTAAAGAWAEVADRLAGKRVMVLWGQSDRPDAGMLSALDHFTRRVDALIIADHLGNLHHPAVLPKAFAALRTGKGHDGTFTPDVVITVGGTLFLIEQVKSLLASQKVEHWRVDPDGRIVDPFRQLTDVFQVDAETFFRSAAPKEVDAATPYRDHAIEAARSVQPLPTRFGEMTTIGALLERLPDGCAVHIGNSAPMRMAHLYEIPSGVDVLGNRGVNGIDGSVSATVGFAAASGKLTFLVIGDLSFFYDMNAIWIRHRGANIRLLVLNNGGGALMHSPLPQRLAAQTARHTSAEHAQSVRGWVESVGFRYLQATDADSLNEALPEFVDTTTDAPMVLEVFSEKVDDIAQLNRYHSANADVSASAYRKVRRLAGRTLRRLGLRG